MNESQTMLAETMANIMKPTIITCGGCSGKLHIIPYREGNTIKTMNICGKCTFGGKYNE